jgi:uncharacterized protein (DUF1697 family)
MVTGGATDESPTDGVPPVSCWAMETTYVALLRGINVGGKNRILMADLRACLEEAGYEDVRTYIQSGNVVFRSTVNERETLRHDLERRLAEAFDYAATVELRDLAQMRGVVEAAPAGFGDDRDTLHYDVIFLLPPLAPAEALEALTLRDGVDAAWAGPGVVYTTRVTALASKSGISRIISHPFYQRMTIRNWNTTTKLLALVCAG